MMYAAAPTRAPRTPNDLLRRARLARWSPSGSGRVLSRQELAEAVNAHIDAATGRVACVDGNYIGKLERGLIRWPYEQSRTALCAVFGAARPADLGFYIVREVADESPRTESDGCEMTADPERSSSTLLRTMLVERHWQMHRTFRGQFLRAARELGDREGDPAVGMLDVSERQFQRWLGGARPRPDACRVLESMFGQPIDRLTGSADAGAATAVVGAAGSVESLQDTSAGGASPMTVFGDVTDPVAAVLDRRGGAPVLHVTVLAGASAAIVFGDSGSVVGQPVRVVVAGADDASHDVERVSAGGARVYSMAAWRGQR